jgi:hypothetical protein
MAAAKLNNTQTNNIRTSSFRNSTLNSPGETAELFEVKLASIIAYNIFVISVR